MLNLFQSMGLLSLRITFHFPDVDFKEIIGYALIKGYDINELGVGSDDRIKSLAMSAQQDLPGMLLAPSSSAANNTPNRSMPFNQPRNEDEAHSVFLHFNERCKFTDDDVYHYFNSKFGTVKSVRIPTRDKSMFGFVTFYKPDAVTRVLHERIHTVQGQRIIAYPYKKNPKHI